MESQRIKVSLDDESQLNLSERAARLGMPVATLARDILTEALCKKKKAETEAALIDEMDEMTSKIIAATNRLEEAASRDGTGKLWELMEHNLKWSIVSAMVIDRVLGLIVKNRESYEKIHDESESATLQLFEKILKEINDETR